MSSWALPQVTVCDPPTAIMLRGSANRSEGRRFVTSVSHVPHSVTLLAPRTWSGGRTGKRTTSQSASAHLLHGKYTRRCAVYDVAARLIVLVRQDFTTFEGNQAPAIADY